MSNFEEIKSCMVQIGWCPHQADRWSRYLGLKSLEYFSQIDRSAFSRGSHHECSKAKKCVANQVDVNNYVTKHVEEDCRCHQVGVPSEKLAEISASGGVPLIYVEADESEEKLKLHVTRRKFSSQYVAISHVWSDGMGNMHNNTLPMCQMRQLHRYLERLPRISISERRTPYVPFTSKKSTLFWLDTLCIPVGAQFSDLRSKAINDMALVYATAMQVLVLDAELRQHPCEGTLANELLALILGSNWMSRSWTCQEGVLGVNCTIQFADISIDPISRWCESGPTQGYEGKVRFPSKDTTDHAIYHALYTLLWAQLGQDWKSNLTPYELVHPPPFYKALLEKTTRKVSWLQSVESLQRWLQKGHESSRNIHLKGQLERKNSEEGRVLQFVQAWDELGYRTTSQPEDIHVIIANLLDFQAGDVMTRASRVERMQAMLLSFDSLPFSLFYNTGPKCKDSPNKWLPIEPSKSLIDSYPLMKRNTDGFSLVYMNHSDKNPTILLAEGGVFDGRPFRIRETGKVEDIILNPFAEEEDLLAARGIGFSCVVMEKDPFTFAGQKIRGALFWVTNIESSPNAIKELRTIYRCPVEAWTVPLENVKTTSTDEYGDVLHTYNAERVLPSTRLVVEYG